MIYDNIINDCKKYINEYIKDGNNINEQVILNITKKIYDLYKKKIVI